MNTMLRSPHSGKQGVALIVVLSAVVLISVIVIAFLMRAEGGRKIAWSSAAQFRAESIAQTGLEVVVGDILSEIEAGSDLAGGGAFPLWIPSSAATSIPWRSDDEDALNVVKKSNRANAFWTGAAYRTDAPQRALASSTKAPARNGRFISETRWNAPFLMGPALPTDFVAPDWIPVTRGGVPRNPSSLPALTSLRDKTANNRNFVIGRFAYTLYDVGGLLDVNLLGYPTSVSNDFRSKRGFLPQVGLGGIPGITGATTLINWRNPEAGANPTAYQDRTYNTTDGLRTVVAGEQQFVSRQDLIRYVKDHPAAITNEALQYLTIFAYGVEAPSYAPDPNRPKVGSGDDSYNPSLINTPVTTPFIRANGSNAEAGEPLIQKRFPLRRLGLLTATATAPAVAGNDIYRYFGLSRGSSSEPWVYRGDAASILTLEEVATAGREPDFFELLQAGMLHGSLGTAASAAVHTGIGGITSGEDSNIALQISQIVANLIDQYDADSIPTRIKIGGSAITSPVAGVENLPYLVRVAGNDFATVNQASGTFGIWLQPEVWNPHAQAETLTGVPPHFRFIATGTANFSLWFPVVGKQFSPPQDLSTIPGITFSPNVAFAEPTYINTTQLGATTSAGNTIDSSGAHSVIGIHLGTLNLTATEANTRGAFQVLPSPSISFELQYSMDGTNWVTYDQMRNVRSGVEVFNDHKFISTIPHIFWMRSDPRSDHFGSIGWWMDDATGLEMGRTIRPGTDDGGNLNSIAIGTMADNRPASTTHYSDRDGVVRAADGGYASGNILAGRPMATNNLTNRPVILNRPFRTVGDMAYASRGMPWRSIDFFHSDSADAALLDLFCIHEAPDDRLVAGRVNLNTRQPVVLEALLDGAIRGEVTNTLVTGTEAAAYADSLIALTSGSSGVPLKNRSELVTRWMSALSAAGSDVTKPHREASLRALAEVGETRTWNLMIDLIAQSGRFVATAANHDDFIVEGERRYWLHLAIDRYTGKVVRRSIEQVQD